MPKTNAQIQAARRAREKVWLKTHGFTSWEAVHTALMRGKFGIGQPSPSISRKRKKK